MGFNQTVQVAHDWTYETITYHHMQNILRLQGKELLISNNILIELQEKR